VCVVAAVVHGNRVLHEPRDASVESLEVKETCWASMKDTLNSLDVPALFGAARGMGRGIIMKSLLYRMKWNVARDVQAIPGQNVTWDSMIDSEVYTEERRRLKALGKMAVKEDNSSELAASSVCDLGKLTMKKIAKSKSWQGLSALTACQDLSSINLQHEVELALEDLCFSSCADAMQPLAKKCDGTGFTNETINQMLGSNEQCLRLSYDSLEDLANYQLVRRCARFPPKSLLWETDDKNPGDLSQEGDSAVCQIGTGKGIIGQRKMVAEQVGICPEGTNCKCPRPSVFDRSTTSQYRTHSGKFLSRGSFSAASLMRQNVAGSLLVGTGGVAALIATGIFVPPVGIAGAAYLAGTALGTALTNADWQCRHTLGCWPNYADQVASKDPVYLELLLHDLDGMHNRRPNCRMPEKAKKGGSPMWFMPPPGLAMKVQGGTCKLTSCSEEDLMQERIGFHAAVKNYDVIPAVNPHVYNCQPLSFEDMTPSKQRLFVQIVRQTDRFKEYKSEYPQVSVDK